MGNIYCQCQFLTSICYLNRLRSMVNFQLPSRLMQAVHPKLLSRRAARFGCSLHEAFVP